MCFIRRILSRLLWPPLLVYFPYKINTSSHGFYLTKCFLEFGIYSHLFTTGFFIEFLKTNDHNLYHWEGKRAMKVACLIQVMVRLENLYDYIALLLNVKTVYTHQFKMVALKLYWQICFNDTHNAIGKEYRTLHSWDVDS